MFARLPVFQTVGPAVAIEGVRAIVSGLGRLPKPITYVFFLSKCRPRNVVIGCSAVIGNTHDADGLVTAYYDQFCQVKCELRRFYA